ncbi:hypothetical protein PI124_g3854 [Phytophthora idaei]|nr:hypothetical protein PI125_g2257 [Phytophthora idaei]KAG3168434.1 hypothetical protein PI126_g3318 [Phytophthora idaei]KAG3251509.1 hypothetical protein PI124_g3854 [Phytophthora idaei]
MAASSQGEDDEERRALERELAAELATISAQDVWLDEDLNGDVDENDDIAGCGRNGEIEMDYVRLDLDNVLKQVTISLADEAQDLLDEEHQVPPTSWELLLQSVERSDREFFQPCQETLNEIRSSILDVNAAPSHENQLEQQPSDEIEVQRPVADVKADQPCIISQPDGNAIPEDRETSQDKIGECKQESSNTDDEKIVTGKSIDDMLERNVLAPVDPTPPLNASDHASQVSALPDVSASNSPEENQLAHAQAKQKELQAIAKQHEARELRRFKTQARYEKERTEAAQLLLHLQKEFETQERNAAISRREAQERSLMATEEIFCRQFAAAEREAQESALMTLADEDSHEFAVELNNMKNAINWEIRQMEAEDEAERRRMKVERQLQYQKQETVARCHFTTVLLDLVKHHETQRQIREKQSKRERRECVHMRAEESYTRRIIAENRVLYEQREHEINRILMIDEDLLANAVEDQDRRQKVENEERLRERDYRESMQREEELCHSAWALMAHTKLVEKQNEEHSRLAMEQEEKRCRYAWKSLVELAEAEAKERERQRETQRLRMVSTVFQRLDRVFERHQLMKFLTKWKKWHDQRIEEDRKRSETEDNAAKRIQIWHRSRRQRLQQGTSIEPPLVLEDFSGDEEQPHVEEESGDNNAEVETEMVLTTETQEAARRLQSTFRGFHVRRKFANALALAHVVEKNEDGDFFDVVDLDDLIQLPPELVDGWEDPVLPPTSVLTPRQYPATTSRIDRLEERSDHVDNQKLVDLENDKSLEHVKPASVPNPPKEQNLAATLWNKMKRVKLRQQKSHQERQRQQDPVYRVQKLLNHKPNNRNQNGKSSNNQKLQTPQGGQQATNMVSWSSTTNTKKKPKVKLPSLVERLRKQTMAER